jgi:hypothetical protein
MQLGIIRHDQQHEPGSVRAGCGPGSDFEDTAGQCKALTAKEDLTLEAILAQYGEIISSDADDESVFYLTDPEEVPVGAIRPRQSTPFDNAMAREDDDRTAGLTNEENTVATQIIALESLHKKSEHVDDDVDKTNGAPPALATNTGIFTDEDCTVE